MKAIGGLYDRIGTHSNLAGAAWRAAQGKCRRPEVAGWLVRSDEHLTHMAAGLAEGTYRFSPYRAFAIRDPKSRTIHAPPFGDRVMHHAIMAVCGPVLESGADFHSYACRLGKGHHAALEQATRWLCPDQWFLKLDIRKYYDSLPQALLLRQLRRRFREARLLNLWEGLLNSYSTEPGRGLPIGALTSQYLGNFFLDGIDRQLRRACPSLRFCRYMDDFLLLGTRESLLHAREVAVEALSAAGLEIKGGGVLNRVSLGVPFLGFTLYPGRTRLNPAGRRRLRRRCRSLASLLRRERREPVVAELASLTSQFAHAGFGSDKAWRRHLCDRLENLWERQGPASRDARRILEQHGQELPLGVPQQEEAPEPQQEPGLPPLLVLRHGGDVPPPDDAFSSAPPLNGGDKHPTPPPGASDIHPRSGAEKEAPGGLGQPY